MKLLRRLKNFILNPFRPNKPVVTGNRLEIHRRMKRIHF